MRINVRRNVGVVVVALGIAFCGVAVQASGAPFFQEHEHQESGQDYSRNKAYNRGIHDGQADRAHNRDHSKKRHFKRDKDRKDYEAGYEHGRSSRDR